MRAMTYDSYGDSSVLVLHEVDDPKVGPGEVRIRVLRTSVNPVDWKLMAGGLDGLMDAWFPAIPCWDVAGVVETVGIDTPEFAVGDEVMSYARKDVVHGGTAAELVTMSVRGVAPKPAALTWDQAGGLPLAGLTALQSLDRVGLTAGETVLVHGAAGGVGTIAVQIAHARGARVIATASTRNHEFLLGLGATHAVEYGDGLADRVRELAPDGVDVVVDYVGGVLDTTVAVLAPGGRHASIADPAVLDAGGTWCWVRPDAEGLRRLGDLADRGGLTVEVAEVFPLERLADAFTASQEGHTRGKIVVHVAD
jgi:NADPH:quinone reductase-like Zn-dependent oxidoreductase